MGLKQRVALSVVLFTGVGCLAFVSYNVVKATIEEGIIIPLIVLGSVVFIAIVKWACDNI